MKAESDAERLMIDFARRTGLAGSGSPRRYLWTDAFAVCNFLEVYQRRRDPEARALALDLVEQVHGTLGRHRRDDERRGWISGLGDEEGAAQPTIGGLRIGKELPERPIGIAPDETVEWDRDGQYFHYLTKWMHALDRVATVLGDPTPQRWAVELAKTACARFTVRSHPNAPPRMYWKMSVDLERPQVASMGQHDPLDGLITFWQLQRHGGFDLRAEIATMAEMCAGRSWTTDDPLGIGGLLCDAYRLVQLADGDGADADLLDSVVGSASQGLQYFAAEHPLHAPAERRLAFRELGLAIGLHAARRAGAALDRGDLAAAALGETLRRILRFASLAEEIERFWLQGSNRQTQAWVAHRDINEVMLATSLAPDGFLDLGG